MSKFYFLFLIVISTLGAAEPIAVYLTIQEKPESSMTVCWVTPLNTAHEVIKYREADSENWFQIDIPPKPFPEKLPYALYVASLENLSADKRYEFVISDEKAAYAFRTLPAVLDRPVKFVAGGDIYHDEIATVEQMNKVAAQQNPDFALLGGDIAYSGSKFLFLKEESKRWIQFLKSWSKTMIREEGTLIPLITAIGNHDISGRYDQKAENALFYYFLFPTPVKTGYRLIDFGNYATLWILDSGHSCPVLGEQSRWLEETLKSRGAVPFKLALYHVPAYPSARSHENTRSTAVRSTWVPLFEKYGIKAAFENHDHAYKRTHLIKEGRVAKEGILYVGDGAWGVELPRLPRTPKQLWYLAASAQKRHIVLATMKGTQLSIEAINPAGEVFDSFTF